MAKKTLTERLADLWTFIQGSPTYVPTQVRFRPDRTDQPDGWHAPFQPDKHYFQVRVNELFLKDGREWFSLYDPMVYTLAEFGYDDRTEAVPSVVGPLALDAGKTPVPQKGMVLTDQNVSGLYPYRGGPLRLTVVLARTSRKNHARDVLAVVEGVAGAVGLTAAGAAFARVSGAVLDGIETTFQIAGTQPLVGQRLDLDGNDLTSQYRALIHDPEKKVDKDALFVRENRLVQGKSLREAKEVREADYVLYSIERVPTRTDDNTLPFYPLLKRVKEEASRAGGEAWKRAKANMLALHQALAVSPDVTFDQAGTLADAYLEQMKALHERAKRIEAQGGDATLPQAVRDRLEKAVGILDLN